MAALRSDVLQGANAATAGIGLLDCLGRQRLEAVAHLADGAVQGKCRRYRTLEQSQIGQGIIVAPAPHRPLEFGCDEGQQFLLGGHEFRVFSVAHFNRHRFHPAFRKADGLIGGERIGSGRHARFRRRDHELVADTLALTASSARN